MKASGSMLSSMLMLFGFWLLAASSAEAWTLSISTKQLDHFLSDSGSTLGPVVKVSVTYAEQFYGVTNANRYEDLYYGRSQPIGCIRHHALDVTDGTRGEIIVTSPPLRPSEVDVLANVIERLYLDLYMKDCQVRDVIVPRDSFHAIKTGLCQHGFRDLPGAGSSEPMDTLILLHLVSDPPGFADYLELQR